MPPKTAFRPERDKTNECMEKKRQEVKFDDDAEQFIYLPTHLLLVFPSGVLQDLCGRKARGKLCICDKDLCDVLLVPWRLALGAFVAS